ncbi:hypothetical protein FHY16_002316 [Xanthomonas campestris]|uniref:hypothetical protein n=1 Tax=Xanthomonas euroxanthea TaxID=2259622 RepID=UPI001618AA01|nr:hypothetical protein [Xanthomonas euroxanthea]MBB3779546.1 hypothetical protein [Xanthomonas euroxanthea]
MSLPSLLRLKQLRQLRSPRQEPLPVRVRLPQLGHLQPLAVAQLLRAARAWQVALGLSPPQLPHLLLFR